VHNFCLPVRDRAVDWTAGWDEGAAGSGEDDDGAVHPQMIAIPTRRISRRTENFLIRDMIGGSPVILFFHVQDTGRFTVIGLDDDGIGDTV